MSDMWCMHFIKLVVVRLSLDMFNNCLGCLPLLGFHESVALRCARILNQVWDLTSH